jgi:hypothetical protein
MTLTYHKGDVLQDLPNNVPIVIPHICNNKGGWGAGFVVALSKKWQLPEQKYRLWAKEGAYIVNEIYIPFQLGKSQCVKVENNVFVVNMVGQNSLVSSENPIPIKYASLVRCMEFVSKICKKLPNTVEIRAPKFGSGLAGGDWDFIEALINEIWVSSDLTVKIYEL